MSILKKITKKYKWLRILNYKTTKLAILSAALFGLCLSSGASFAKYRDENYGNGGAGVAHIGDIYLEDINSYITNPTDFENLSTDIHAFILGFTVVFENFEVSISYDLNLRLSPFENNDFEYETSQFSQMNTKFYLSDSNYIDNPNTFKLRTFVDGKQEEFGFKGQTGLDLEINKYYIAKSDDSISYTWKSYKYDLLETDVKKQGIISVDSGNISPQDKVKKYYKLLVFVDPIEEYIGTELIDVIFEKSKILYQFDINQVQ